jgi:superfamily II DNA/RNA helicase
MSIHSGLHANARDRIIKEFNEHGSNIDIVVCSYGTSQEGLNLHRDCHVSIHVEQGASYALEHQAWSRIRRIGQTKEQQATRIINLETIDLLIENSQRNKQNPMFYAFGIIDKLAREAERNNPIEIDDDNDNDEGNVVSAAERSRNREKELRRIIAKELYNSLNGKLRAATLKDMVIGARDPDEDSRGADTAERSTSLPIGRPSPPRPFATFTPPRPFSEFGTADSSNTGASQGGSQLLPFGNNPFGNK